MRARLPPLAVLIATPSGANTAERSRSPRPSAIRICVALGESWMPAPSSDSRAACSRRVTRKPACASIKDAVSPPIPAPAMMTLREDATAPGRSDRFGQGTGLWPCGMGVEGGIVPVQRRAIRADDLPVGAHVEEDVGVVVRRLGAAAHEFARADLDHRDAGVVVEMRDDVVGHRITSELVWRRTIAARPPIS